MDARALICPQCGAQLEWKGTPTVVECRYCKAHVHTSLGTRTDEPADAIAGRAVARVFLFMIVASIAVGVLAVVAVVMVVAIAPRASTTSAPPPAFSVVSGGGAFTIAPASAPPPSGAPKGPTGGECGKGRFDCGEGMACLFPVTPGDVAPGTCMDVNLCRFARSQQPKQITCRDASGRDLP